MLKRDVPPNMHNEDKIAFVHTHNEDKIAFVNTQ